MSETAVKNPSQTVIIWGPNLPRSLSDSGTLHVHDVNCADLRKGAYRHLRKDLDQGGYVLTFNSIPEIVENIYPADNFLYDPEGDEYSGYRNDIHVFPCVHLSE